MRVADEPEPSRAPESSYARRLVAAFPVFVAASVAFLYSLGSIELVGQLREDHVDALAALPLVPLQQVLGRGIWVVTHELPWLLILGVVGIYLGERVGHKGSKRKREIANGAIGLFGCAVLLALAPLVLVRMLLTLCAGVVVAFPVRERFARRFSLNEIAAAGAVFAILYTASGAIVTPDHLPVAKLKLENGSASGALIAFDGSTWYLGRHGKIDAIPTRFVRSSRIERVGRHHDRPLWRLSS